MGGKDWVTSLAALVLTEGYVYQFVEIYVCLAALVLTEGYVYQFVREQLQY